jgi:hypothetical protein
MITDTPAEDVIDRGSLQGRLEEVELLIAQHPADQRAPVKACLTYRGRPVVGSYGIFADFGMLATKAFTDAISMLAASLEGPLAAMGPIPNRRNNQLIITNTATGSFGFELEEHRDEALILEEEDSSLVAALSQTREILQSAALGTDDELTDAASGKEERVVAAIRAFLKTLIDHDAVCGFTVKERAFSFTDVGEVRRSWERLEEKTYMRINKPLQELLKEFSLCGARLNSSRRALRK